MNDKNFEDRERIFDEFKSLFFYIFVSLDKNLCFTFGY
jgi:hypothetical protein